MDLNVICEFVPFERKLTEVEVGILTDIDDAEGFCGVDVIVLDVGVILVKGTADFERRKEHYLNLAKLAIETSND